MDLYQAIEYICVNDAELKAVFILLKSHERKHEKNLKDLCDREASLKIIYKLNQVHYKDEAINALSDIDNYDN